MSSSKQSFIGWFGLTVGFGTCCPCRFFGRIWIFACILLGSIPALTTSAAPSAPSALNTTNLKATSFTLKWAAATGGSGGIASYDVYRDGLLIGSPTARTFAVAGLTPTTTYSMTVNARDGAGSVSPPSVALPVTTAVDTTNPTRPADLAALYTTTTSFTLTWTGSTDDVGVTGYNIYRASTLVGTTTSTAFDVTGLTADVNNRMTVRATDAAGNLSGVSVALVVRTLADPPSATSGLSVANLKAASFTLKWTAATGGTGGIASYDVYRDGLLAGTTARRSFAFTGLTPLTTYSLTVASRDAVGNVSPQSAPLLVTTPADTTKPTVPVDLSAANVTHNSFTLGWTPSTDNVGVTGYDVLKNGALIGFTPTANFNVTGQSPMTAYSMRVKAKDAAGNISAASTILSVTTSMVPNAPPAVALTAPAAGATFTLPLNLTLSATATDPDGAIAKVEFFEGTTKLGETLAPSILPSTFTLPLTFSAAGPHTLTARATDNRNATSDSAPVTFQLLAGLPYVSGFEASEGYTPGSLDGQHGWTVSAGTAQVTTADASTGEQSVVLSPGAAAALVDQEFGAGSSNPAVVFFDLFAKPVAGADAASGTIFDLDNARLAFALNDTMGRFDALDGDGNGAGIWKNISGEIDLDGNNATSTWQRLTVRLDYMAKTWDFNLNGRLLATDLRFRFSAATYLSGVSFRGHTAAGAGLDDVYAGADNPLFADTDKDGMDDAWETTHGLNPTLNDRNGDLDGDGLTNIQENILGTNPNAADTDGDGLSDAQEFALGTNPVNADTDNDGIPDGWEHQHDLNPLAEADAAIDTDGDGQTNVQEYGAGTNPADFYNGQTPVLTIVSGNSQSGQAGEFNTQPFVVSVTNAAGMIALVNAPVSFAVQSGGGQLALTNTGGPALSTTLNTRVDAEGVAQIYFQQPGTPNVTSMVLVTAGTAQAIFSTTSIASGPVDSDRNGLPDAWEMQYFGGLGVDPNTDSDGDGLTNAEEFTYGTSPNDPTASDFIITPILEPGNQLFNDFSMQVQVTNLTGRPVPNVLVTITSQNRNNLQSGTQTGRSLTLRTDTNGLLKIIVVRGPSGGE